MVDPDTTWVDKVTESLPNCRQSFQLLLLQKMSRQQGSTVRHRILLPAISRGFYYTGDSWNSVWNLLDFIYLCSTWKWNWTKFLEYNTFMRIKRVRYLKAFQMHIISMHIIELGECGVPGVDFSSLSSVIWGPWVFLASLPPPSFYCGRSLNSVVSLCLRTSSVGHPW